MPKSKLSAFLMLALVFASGVLVGAVAHRLYAVNSVTSRTGSPPPPGKKTDPEEYRRRILAEMKTKIQLTDQQVERLDRIMDQTRDQFDQLRKTADESMKIERDKIWKNQVEQIKLILTPEQIPLYDKYRADREAGRKKHRNPGPGPK